MSAPAGATRDGPLALSVVVPSVTGLTAVTACLDALAAQRDSPPHEILVVDRLGGATREALRARARPPVVLVETEPHASIPAMRAIAVERARGRQVAVIEDHCLLPPHWLARAAEHGARGHAVVAGPIENGATGTLRDQATFLAEYAAFMPPVEGGPVAAVPGVAIAYDRRLLLDLADEVRSGRWEFFLHRELAARGVVFRVDPELCVVHDRPFGFGEFMSQRYHFSRSFAGQRAAGAPSVRRLALAAAGLASGPLVLLRTARAVLVKGRRRGTFLACLPWLVPFFGAYAWGEVVGALLGEGASTRRVA